ncbi:Crp/Fnr family transcriptional regulator [Altererythrobacter sp. SALINAS58]|uniref:Crp/Fnr family transcriptional regulator n=1 Tax=Alteripontixanthobacter muriae TaxID=2705546 RepID=UPI0015760081|nr:Crp/Fnr family transcriptional regulator [Alteripontixanthobacter muriae]NTZ42544.1 Crp/Fnr family transcriptional regulator [Alteripontixanthobacter muriae]
MTSTNHPLDLLVRNLELRARLSQEDRDAILALPYTLRTLDHLTYTIREGDPPRECAVLVSGFAYRQKTTQDGARQIIALHLPGDALDFQNMYLKVSDHSVQMLTRGEVAIIAREELQELAQARPAIGHAILIKTLVEASIFREWVLNVGRRKARERMAHVLCELGSRMDALGLTQEHGYELPMTQEELADALGLTPVHVNRTLKLLEAEGLIMRTRRSIRFPDWERIREAADFNERYLHLDLQVPSSS